MKRLSRNERFAIRLSRAERAALEQLALEQDLTLTQVMRQGIKQLVAHRREGAPQ